jgi:PadR family transcriptional regulator PadR
MTSDLDLPQGTLDLLILKVLTWGPRHGYAIARLIEERTGEKLSIEEGSLYPALYRMERKDWIKAEWGVSELGRNAKFYSLTRAGRGQLAREVDHWRTVTEAVEKVLRTGHA